jgi:hypothetical protein
MTGDEPGDDGDGTRLLTDLDELWANNEDYMFTSMILKRLHKIEESPWAEWGRKNEGISARALASLLKPYGVRSKTVRIAGETSKGYARKDLADPWNRYVAGTRSDTSVTASHDGEKPDLSSEDACDGSVTDTDFENVTGSDQREEPFCDAVTDVTHTVRETLSSDDWTAPDPDRHAAGNGQRPRCKCGEELVHPESIRRGNCHRCFLASKQGELHDR